MKCIEDGMSPSDDPTKLTTWEFEIPDSWLSQLSSTISETGITPLIHRQPAKGCTVLECQTEADAVLLKLALETKCGAL